MASSKIQKRFEELEQRVAQLEALLAAAMSEDDDDGDEVVTPAPDDVPTTPNLPTSI